MSTFKYGQRSNRFKQMVMAGVSLLLAGCVTIPKPTAWDAQAARARWPGTSLAMLERGRALYMERCTTCHRAVDPQLIIEAAWPAQVKRMQKRAHSSDDDAEDITRFILSVRQPGGGREPRNGD